MRIALLLALATAALAQQQHPPGWLMSGTGNLGNLLVVEFRCMAEPALNDRHPLSISTGGIATERGRVHRYMVDRESRTYFGYDLTAVQVAQGTYHVDILPLQPPQNLAGLTPAAIPRIPSQQTIHDGEEIALRSEEHTSELQSPVHLVCR